MCERYESCSRHDLGRLLADPLIQLVMQADRVWASDIEEVFRRVGGKVRGRSMAQELPGASKPVALHPSPDPAYRSGVGIMLLNADDKIFVGQRLSPDDAWQMPQGGIEPEEHPRQAALRELREEIGTDKVTFIAESRGWLRYDLPPDLAGKAWGGRWRGQQQKWFGMRFQGTDADIAIATEHPEFSAWRWERPAQIVERIVAFKRDVYGSVFEEFQAIHAK